MRPHELDVALTLYQLDCTSTEDNDGDEPYLWILGFKVDAETMGPPPVGSLIPSLGVKTIPGIPAFPNIVGAGQEVNAGRSYPIPAALGTRTTRLKPAPLPVKGWFPGLVGVVCLLWDQDNFDPSTSEAGHAKFNSLFGAALSTELNKLVNGGDGGYDDELARDSAHNLLPDPPDGRTLDWRLARLRDAAGRKNAVKAITKNVKEQIVGSIKSAIKAEAGWDELLDPDDLLGADAQVFLGDELTSMQSFQLTFTDDDTNYTVRGHAHGTRVHAARLDSVVTSVERVNDRDKGVWRQVCWFDMQLYWASAYRLRSTTRFELRTLVGEPPTSVRWFLDDTPLTNGSGSLTLNFESLAAYVGPPQDVLAPSYQGGPAPVTYQANGPILDIRSESGNGVFFGKIRALYAYTGDPSLFPAFVPPLNELLGLGYEQEAELSITAVVLEMNDAYKADVARCARAIAGVDAKHIPVNFGKLDINPGDPPPYREQILEEVAHSARLIISMGLEAAPQLRSTPLTSPTNFH